MNDEKLTLIKLLERIVEIKSTQRISLYDKGWMTLYYLKADKKDLEFFKLLEYEIRDILSDKKKLGRILLTAPETTGFVMGLFCLLSIKRLNKDKALRCINNIIKQIDELKWMEYDEELLYSFSLLNGFLKIEIPLEEILKKTLDKSKQYDKVRARVYALLTLSNNRIEDHKEFIFSLIQELITKDSLNIIKGDLELSSLLIFALSHLLDKFKFDKQYRSKYEELIDELFRTSYSNLLKIVHNPRLFNELIEIASILRETGRINVTKNFQSVIQVDNKRIHIDLEKLPMSTMKISLISKFLIAALESGFYKPYFISKKERTVYFQLKGEIRSFKRIRKYELFAIFLSVLAFVGWISWRIFTSFLSPIYSIIPTIAIVITVLNIFYQLYEKGYVSLKELYRSLASLIKR